jgi:hypothetical protein
MPGFDVAHVTAEPAVSSANLPLSSR